MSYCAHIAFEGLLGLPDEDVRAAVDFMDLEFRSLSSRYKILELQTQGRSIGAVSISPESQMKIACPAVPGNCPNSCGEGQSLFLDNPLSSLSPFLTTFFRPPGIKYYIFVSFTKQWIPHLLENRDNFLVHSKFSFPSLYCLTLHIWK